MSEHIPVELVTPAKAEAWLNRNCTNRKMRPGVAERYASDMSNGRWTKCPVPISFYEDGELADGQHRLWAIVESGASQRFPVLRGLSRADGLNLDTGLGRSIVDNAKISGIDGAITNSIVAAARAIHNGGPVARVKGTSYSDKLAMVEQHRSAAEWAVNNVRRVRFLNNAVIHGAVGRAWYHETDKARLKRFCDVLGSGMADGMHESAAIALRNYLLSKGALASSSAMWYDTFTKAQNCIAHFMRNRSLTVLKKQSDEVYALAPGTTTPTSKRGVNKRKEKVA